MIGQTISIYKILTKPGEGGMGVVYKAEETKLRRIVAIKSLPRQIAASDDERERFKIEAHDAKALSIHPHQTGDATEDQLKRYGGRVLLSVNSGGRKYKLFRPSHQCLPFNDSNRH